MMSRIMKKALPPSLKCSLCMSQGRKFPCASVRTYTMSRKFKKESAKRFRREKKQRANIISQWPKTIGILNVERKRKGILRLVEKDVCDIVVNCITVLH